MPLDCTESVPLKHGRPNFSALQAVPLLDSRTWFVGSRRVVGLLSNRLGTPTLLPARLLLLAGDLLAAFSDLVQLLTQLRTQTAKLSLRELAALPKFPVVNRLLFA